jgi:hypothetical protein
MECPICYEPIEAEKWEPSDIENQVISTVSEVDRPITTYQQGPNHSIQIPVIQCPTRKHDLCNTCLIKWMKESVEHHKDIRCVICNQVIHLRREIQRQQLQAEAERRRQQEEADITAAEIRLHQMIREGLERNIVGMNQMMSRFCVGSSSTFGVFFMIYLFIPSNKSEKMTYLLIFYICFVSLLFLGMYLNRLFYISQLNSHNRIHPEQNGLGQIAAQTV